MNDTLMKLAIAYHNGNWRTRRLYRAKADKILRKASGDVARYNLLAIEWCKLAGTAHIPD